MNLEDALQKLPATIRRTDFDLFKQTQALDGARHRLKLREGDLAAAIAKENADTKAYPNADARDAELRRRLAIDAEAAALKREVVEAEVMKARITATLDYYRDVQRNARAMALARSPVAAFFDDPEALS